MSLHGVMHPMSNQWVISINRDVQEKMRGQTLQAFHLAPDHIQSFSHVMWPQPEIRVSAQGVTTPRQSSCSENTTCCLCLCNSGRKEDVEIHLLSLTTAARVHVTLLVAQNVMHPFDEQLWFLKASV